MAVYTDKEYYMDAYMVNMLDLMCDRMDRNLDNWIVCDGDEGTGKSNLTAGVCYYIAWKTGRKFDIDNVFFDVDKFIDFAKSTKNQVILWDEAALGGLSEQWQSKIQQRLIQLAMVCRKKNHFVVLNIPKFFKLREYLILDRSIALLHSYSADQKTNGTFTYYNKESKEKLYNDWKKTRRRNYKMHFNFRGRFIKALPLVLDEEEYERKKDEAILSIGKDKEEFNSKYKIKLERYMRIISGLPDAFGITQQDLAKYLGIGSRTLREWKTIGVSAALNNNHTVDENFDGVLKEESNDRNFQSKPEDISLDKLKDISNDRNFEHEGDEEE